jgi:hypothetical protein
MSGRFYQEPDKADRSQSPTSSGLQRWTLFIRDGLSKIEQGGC